MNIKFSVRGQDFFLKKHARGGTAVPLKRSAMGVGVKHCTIFIIVADESARSHPRLSESACVLSTSDAQFKLNSFFFSC